MLESSGGVPTYGMQGFVHFGSILLFLVIPKFKVSLNLMGTSKTLSPDERAKYLL